LSDPGQRLLTGFVEKVVNLHVHKWRKIFDFLGNRQFLKTESASFVLFVCLLTRYSTCLSKDTPLQCSRATPQQRWYPQKTKKNPKEPSLDVTHKHSPMCWHLVFSNRCVSI